MVAVMYTSAHKGMCGRNPADGSHTNQKQQQLQRCCAHAIVLLCTNCRRLFQNQEMCGPLPRDNSGTNRKQKL